jgi:catechol 2,3-dioxygenase-like lactoylglutathione lyase family enzyme
MVKGVAHVCFIVRDLEPALEFYQGVLGLKPAFDFINDKGQRYGIYLHAGHRTFIELFQSSHGQPADGQSYRHLCLEVDDVAKTVERLKTHGMQTSDVIKGKDHSWQAWLEDPDGNKIELMSYTHESQQLQSIPIQ